MKQLLSIACLALCISACGEDIVCDYHGEKLLEGQSTVDEERALRCSCTADGLTCVDASAESGLPAPMASELGPDTSASPTRDMGEMAPRDAGMDPSRDAMASTRLDSSTPCGPTPMHGGTCDVPDQVCHYGPVVRCCGDVHPAETQCVCRGGRYECEEADTLCEQAHAGERCLRIGQVCSQWLGTRDQVDPRDWNGDVAACQPGEMTPEWRALVLRRLNAFRIMAGQHTVTTSPELNRKAQACSLLVAAHGLDHRPPPDAPCYTEEGADAARASLLDRLPALAALPDYIHDPGAHNYRTMSHRVWLLSNVLGPVGIGSTDQSACLWVHNGQVGSRRDPAWTSWPGAGPFPYDAVLSDDTGWTVQTSTYNLAYGVVRVHVDGAEQAIDYRQLEGGGGAQWSMAFQPVGWRPEPGTTYHIEVSDRRSEDILFEYEVELIDCEAAFDP